MNAVYYNQIMELPESERAAYVRDKRDEYARTSTSTSSPPRCSSTASSAGSELRDELIKRLAYAESKQLAFPPRRNPDPSRV